MSDYEYIRMEEVPFDGKTSKWRVLNKRHGDELGIVKWYSGWRQYCYFPTVQAVYSAGCLNDIQSFIDGEMKARTT